MTILDSINLTSLSLGQQAATIGNTSIVRSTTMTVQTSESTTSAPDGIGANLGAVGKLTAAGLNGLVLQGSYTNLIKKGANVSGTATGDGASYNPPTGGAIFTDGSTSGILDPAGGSLAPRWQMTVGGGVFSSYGPGFLSNPGAGNWVMTTWYRATSGTSRFAWSPDNWTTIVEDLSATTIWKRFVSLQTNVSFWFPFGGENRYPGSCDYSSTFSQLESGYWAHEYLHNQNISANRTASGDQWKHSTASMLVDAGRIGIEIKITPRSSSDNFILAGGTRSIWFKDANNQVFWTATTQQITIIQGGTSVTLGGTVTWSTNDILEIWIAGGGNVATRAAYRLNAGTLHLLSDGSALSNYSLTGTLDLLNQAASNVFESWTHTMTFYSASSQPSWVINSPSNTIVVPGRTPFFGCFKLNRSGS